MDPLLTLNVIDPPVRDARVRRLNRCPEAIEASVRRIVHDYVDGWDVIGPQSSIARRQ